MAKNMTITLEQQKIISHPLRSQIIMLLYDQTMTAKQVATHLGKSGGSVHYHIQKLYNHGILKLDHEDTSKGIVEKYYRSKALSFTLEDQDYTKKSSVHTKNSATLTLSPEELEQFNERLQELIVEFARHSVSSHKKRVAYRVECTISHDEEDEAE
ncbi:ArsR/SmtB family transcription factor [Alteribacter populi]|uniref:ArsR/SmtB family transcription factor n=1 Tax=Alteribacter populi TaxID=2011011 RepID=UPI000BBA56DE|nr:winged helix-turn-helix domain-containing protein [Alteribacter populi]